MHFRKLETHFLKCHWESRFHSNIRNADAKSLLEVNFKHQFRSSAIISQNPAHKPVGACPTHQRGSPERKKSEPSDGGHACNRRFLVARGIVAWIGTLLHLE